MKYMLLGLIIFTLQTINLFLTNNLDFQRIIVSYNNGAEYWFTMTSFTSFLIFFLPFLFLFIGQFNEQLLSYGYLNLVELKSRKIWLRKQVIKNYKKILITIITYQGLILMLSYLSHNIVKINILNYYVVILLYAIYILMLYGLLEILIKEKYAVVILMIISMTTLTNCYILIQQKLYVLIYLFPINSLSMLRNGINSDASINLNIFIVVLVFYIAIIWILINYVFLRKEIL